MKNFLKNIVIKILTWEAKLLLHNQNPKIIAVTGSVGKTSAKDAIFTVISKKFHALKSDKSLNSEIGIPLTILGLKNAWSNPFKWAWNIKLGFWKIFFSRNYPRILVLEVGADKPNDIKNIVSWLKPNIAVITKLADVPVHVANFPGALEVYEEKRRLIEALGRDGIAVLNADDERVLEMKNKTEARKILFGIHGPLDVLGTHPTIDYDSTRRPCGTSFRIDLEGKSASVKTIGSLGIANTYSVLAASAVGLALGMNIREISERVNEIKWPNGRMKIISGIKNTTIIDDTYNSSPVAVEAALNTLKEIIVVPEVAESGKKIVALGDMRELGRFSETEHKRIGTLVAQVADILITVGPESRFTAEGALNNGMEENKIFQFEDSREAGVFAQNILKEKDIVLAKGSQNTIRMEWFVEEIMAEPENKKDILVRQEKEWKS